MSTSEYDVAYDDYIQHMHKGYIQCLEKLSNAKTMGELADSLEGLERYVNEYPELSRSKPRSRALKDQALSFDTVIRLARKSLNRRALVISVVGAFILGIAVNYAYDLLKGWL